MIRRIQHIQPLSGLQPRALFDDGTEVLYDVAEDAQELEAFRDLLTVHGLFEQARLDPSRTCVYWNDRIDLPSDAIYEYGKRPHKAMNR